MSLHPRLDRGPNRTSPDAQKRLLLDYAQKNDMIVSGDFIFTESVSGRHAQKRPEFQKMIALAKQPLTPLM